MQFSLKSRQFSSMINCGGYYGIVSNLRHIYRDFFYALALKSTVTNPFASNLKCKCTQVMMLSRHHIILIILSFKIAKILLVINSQVYVLLILIIVDTCMSKIGVGSNIGLEVYHLTFVNN